MGLVEDRIARARKDCSTFLDLGNCGLTELPTAVCELEELQTLVLAPTYFHSKEGRTVFCENRGGQNEIAILPKEVRALRHLQELYLGENCLRDIGPLKDLTGLVRLDLGGNRLSDIRPLEGLTELVQLTLHTNQLRDISALSGLTKLTELYLGGNQISDIGPVAELARLVCLNLSENWFMGIDELANLRWLQWLSIGKNRLTDISSVVGLAQLKWLNLSENRLLDVSPLSELQALTWLNLSSNQLRDVSALSEPGEITELYLSGNRVRDIGPLKDLTGLVRLDLGGNRLSDIRPLEGLTELVQLTLHTNQLRDISALSGLTKLTELYLGGNQISDIGPLKNLPRLRALNLSGNPVEDLSGLTNLTQLESLLLSGEKLNGLHVLGNLTQLTSLTLTQHPLSDLSPLKELPQLAYVSLSSNQLRDVEDLSALTELQVLDLSNNRLTDLRPLRHLVRLNRLVLSGNQIQEIQALEGLSHLRELNLSSNPLTDICSLRHLSALTQLTLSANRLDNLSPLAEVTGLTRLQLENAQLTDISVLSGLTRLVYLALSNNQLTDIRPLAGLTQLRELGLGKNQLSDLRPLAGLSQLTHLHLYGNQIRDIQALAGLTQLRHLTLDSNPLTDITPLKGLTQLQWLGLWQNPIRDISVLSGLSQLKRLFLPETSLTDFQPLEHLRQLSQLSLDRCQLASSGVLPGLGWIDQLHLRDNQLSEITDLDRLTQVSQLHLKGNRLSDVRALAGLPRLTELDLVNNQLTEAPLFLLSHPTLERLYLSGNPITDVPLSVLGEYSDCLSSLRAHLEDKKHGVERDCDLKIILIGNGRVGKSSIVNRLIRNAFNPNEKSTHGIRLERWLVDVDGAEVRLHFWDFGGQEIYHGAHSLFLKSQAIFLIVWDEETEKSKGYEEKDLFFEHLPLRYWLDYVQEVSPHSPVLVVQNKCDDGRGCAPPCPVPGAHIPASAATGYGMESLLGAIKDACRKEREHPGRLEIGVGRFEVKEAIQSYLAVENEGSKGARRTLSVEEFRALCDQQRGAVSSWEELLLYLHNSGVVFYRKGLFEDQIILDQRWAIDAIYTIFNREKCYLRLQKYCQGRFRRSDLDELVWQGEHSEEEQKLFLSFMVSCSICFRIGEEQRDPEYLAPALLPEREAFSQQREQWRRLSSPNEPFYFRYEHPFLHPGVMQRFTVAVGKEYGRWALYWKNGLMLEDTELCAMAEIGCAWGRGERRGSGTLAIEVWGAGYRALLQKIRHELEGHDGLEGVTRLARYGDRGWVDVDRLSDFAKLGAVLDQEGERQDLHGYSFLLQPFDQEELEQGAAPRPVLPSSLPTVYCSYKRGSELAEKACQSLRSRFQVKLDTDMKYKESIRNFASEIGRGQCILVVLSDSYLKSDYCMMELLAIYQEKGDGESFLRHICPIRLPDAKITPAERSRYTRYWAQRKSSLLEEIVELGKKGVDTSALYQQFQEVDSIARECDKLIGLVADANMLTVDELEADDFALLKEAVEECLRATM